MQLCYNLSTIVVTSSLCMKLSNSLGSIPVPHNVPPSQPFWIFILQRSVLLQFFVVCAHSIHQSSRPWNYKHNVLWVSWTTSWISLMTVTYSYTIFSYSPTCNFVTCLNLISFLLWCPTVLLSVLCFYTSWNKKASTWHLQSHNFLINIYLIKYDFPS